MSAAPADRHRTTKPRHSRYGFRLEEGAHTAGVTFVHQAPTLIVAGSDPARRRIDECHVRSSTSTAMDGRISMSPTAAKAAITLYRNLGDSTFGDVPLSWGLPISISLAPACRWAPWGDYDNDGEDVLLIKWGHLSCSTTTRPQAARVTEQAGLPRWINANTALWFDYDGDGLLDLFIGYYSSDRSLASPRSHARFVREKWQPKYLLHNLGNGRFESQRQTGNRRVGVVWQWWTRHRPPRSLLR